ncbi:MAG: GTPase Era [PVC group bacterium]|nr:GTPase Era [PVC group bacterium]
MKKKKFKSGFVAFLGKPNVGKSTLSNYFLKEKISIISPKPQTTRDNIRGILPGEGYQIIFVDTPGVHKPRTSLGEYMVDMAVEAGFDADVVLIIIDASSGITGEDRQIFNLLKKKSKLFKDKKNILLINKTDLIKNNRILELIDESQRALKEINIAEYIPISILTEQNLELVLNKIVEYLPDGPAYYPDDQLTDKNERFIAAEMIREQALELCHEEIPHSIAVLVHAMKDNPGRKTVVQADIFVERDSQKSIVIGENGRMLKKIGTASRYQIEKFLDRGIYLELRVKVQKHWRKDKDFLRRLGYSKI